MAKVVEMASEYRLPLLGFVENQNHGVTGEAGIHLASDYGLPLLVQIPWTPEIPMSMDVHVTFDHQIFLPVAEALIARLFFSPATEAPPISENNNLLRQAEAWVSGEPWQAPAPPAAAPWRICRGPRNSGYGSRWGADGGADIGGEPWTEYHELSPAVNLAGSICQRVPSCTMHDFHGQQCLKSPLSSLTSHLCPCQ